MKKRWARGMAVLLKTEPDIDLPLLREHQDCQDALAANLAALNYAADFGWAKFAAAGAWADGGTSQSWDGQFSSSASILFDFGLNFTASYAMRDQNGKDPWNIFGKVGYQFLEKHAASVQWSRTENYSAKDDKGDSFNIAYVFSPWQSVEFYGTYYLHMLDRDQGSDPDDINVFMTGGRVKF